MTGGLSSGWQWVFGAQLDGKEYGKPSPGS